MPTQRIALGEWTPDQPGLVGGIQTALNCYPTATGYAPFPSEADFSDAAAEDLKTLSYSKDQSGTIKLFAAGQDKIYTVDSVGALTEVWYTSGTYAQTGSTTLTVTATAHGWKTGDSVYLNFTSGTAVDGQFTITKLTADTFTITTTSATTSGNVRISASETGFNTPANERIRFTRFGNRTIAANFGDRLQSFVADTSTSFRNLADNAPIAKYVTVVRDFVVAAHLDSAGGNLPYRVQWSDLNDETNWTSAPTSPASQSDYQDIPDGGHITGIRGGEFGLILMEKAIHRMSYVGTPFIFQFDNISREKGCIASGSVSQYQGITFFLSDDGFYMCDGQQVVPIGAEKIDRFFFNDADMDFTTMSSAVDPVRKLVMWNYKSKFAERKLIVYSFTTKKWSVMMANSDYISDATTASVSVEQLDDINASLDALSVSLDSNIYAGGKYFLGGTSGTKVVTFSGANKSATIETGDISTGGRSLVTLARPQVDNGSATVALASRTLLSDGVTFGTATAADSDNRVSLRGSGNYHRIQVNPTGDNWRMAVAVDVEIQPQGVR
jgi:phage baseplate assembly protein gpV